MLLIPCPWCGPRDEREFVHGGDAPATSSSAPAEVWQHRHGCGQWFQARRDRRRQDFLATAPLGQDLEAGHGT